MDKTRAVFLVLLFFFIFFTPAGNAPHTSTANELFTLKDYLDLQRNYTKLLKSSTFESGLVFGEPFLPQEIVDLGSRVWALESTEELIQESDELMELVRPDELIYFKNVSGIYEGSWNQTVFEEKLAPIKLEIPDLFKNSDNLTSSLLFQAGNITSGKESTTINDYSKGNVTDDFGKVSFTINEIASRNHKRANVALIEVTASLFDNTGSSQFSFDMAGFHIKPTGNIILSTASLKYSGLHILPHLLPHEKYFIEARSLMVKYLNSTTNRYEKDLDYDAFEEAELFARECEYIMYGHVHSVPFTKQQLIDTESELLHPMGRPTPKLPALKISGLLYSPDCAVTIQSTDIQGEKYETYWNRLRVIVVYGIVLLFLQMVLLAKQMKDTNTPSLLSKISFQSVIMLIIVDGTIWTASFVSSFVEELSLPFIAVSFLSFALTSMYEMRYMVEIYKAQLPESEVDAQVREVIQANTSNNVNGALFTNSDGSFVSTQRQPQEPGLLPLPVTTALPQTAVPGPQQSERALAGSLYTLLYYNGDGDDESDLHNLISTSGQQHVSTSAIKSPKAGRKQKVDDAEDATNVKRPSVDCAICMMPVELVLVPRKLLMASSNRLVSSAGLILARRRYMVTPCQHVFHTGCMDKWMRSRLQCPICRNPLPPL
ncbi:hypothetical protein D0Z00_004267 [Geotrichum galactomycetum]|uniref:Uncharacterized protein n=1 Tax=Geotrichum galactomycetum TaxID=27317 RepID=A0ACB6UYX8_9ASCO|nr:hypothetical protein D0Z00_004267 [Geotrichum candidum]